MTTYEDVEKAVERFRNGPFYLVSNDKDLAIIAWRTYAMFLEERTVLAYDHSDRFKFAEYEKAKALIAKELK